MPKKPLGLGERLYELRLTKGLTQKELAEPAYTHAYVSTIEAGRRTPSRAALEHFASKLGVTVDELETGRSPGIATRLEAELLEARQLVSGGMTPEAEALVKKVRREAKGLQMPKIEARALETLGSIREKESDLNGAIELYEQALGLLTEEPPTTWAYPTGGLARCFAMKGEAHYGIHLAETLRKKLKDEGLEDPAAMAWLLGPLVFSYFNVGMRREASQLARKAQSLIAAIPDDPAAAALLVNVAQVHQEREEYPEAKAALSRAEEIFRRLNFRAELGITHLSQGYVHSRSGELPEAKTALTTAIEMLEKTGSRGNEANAIAELGRVERLTGDFERAAELLKTSVDLLEYADDKRVLAWSKRELALVYADNSPRKAEALFKEAITLYEATSEVVELARTFRYYGDFLISQGRDQKGHEAHRQGLLVLDKGL